MGRMGTVDVLLNPPCLLGLFRVSRAGWDAEQDEDATEEADDKL